MSAVSDKGVLSMNTGGMTNPAFLANSSPDIDAETGVPMPPSFTSSQPDVRPPAAIPKPPKVPTVGSNRNANLNLPGSNSGGNFVIGTRPLKSDAQAPRTPGVIDHSKFKTIEQVMEAHVKRVVPTAVSSDAAPKASPNPDINPAPKVRKESDISQSSQALTVDSSQRSSIVEKVDTEIGKSTQSLGDDHLFESSTEERYDILEQKAKDSLERNKAKNKMKSVGNVSNQAIESVRRTNVRESLDSKVGEVKEEGIDEVELRNKFNAKERNSMESKVDISAATAGKHGYQNSLRAAMVSKRPAILRNSVENVVNVLSENSNDLVPIEKDEEDDPNISTTKNVSPTVKKDGHPMSILKNNSSADLKTFNGSTPVVADDQSKATENERIGNGVKNNGVVMRRNLHKTNSNQNVLNLASETSENNKDAGDNEEETSDTFKRTPSGRSVTFDKSKVVYTKTPVGSQITIDTLPSDSGSESTLHSMSNGDLYDHEDDVRARNSGNRKWRMADEWEEEVVVDRRLKCPFWLGCSAVVFFIVVAGIFGGLYGMHFIPTSSGEIDVLISSLSLVESTSGEELFTKSYHSTPNATSQYGEKVFLIRSVDVMKWTRPISWVTISWHRGSNVQIHVIDNSGHTNTIILGDSIVSAQAQFSLRLLPSNMYAAKLLTSDHYTLLGIINPTGSLPIMAFANTTGIADRFPNLEKLLTEFS